METQKAIEIAVREWENVRLSLAVCGDIGELDVIDSTKLIRFEGIRIFKSLLGMEDNLSKHGYITQEAAYVFAILGRKAGERLGLEGGLPHIFGSAYSWVRTGCFNLEGMFDVIEEQKYITKQLFFFKLFFPMGGDFNWDFDSDPARMKLNLAFNKFIAWQDDSDNYFRDVRDYGAQLQPLRRGLSLILGLPPSDIGGSYQILGGVKDRLSDDFVPYIR